MGKFSDKFLNAFMKGDDEYDDDFDEYDDILDEDEYFPEDDFEEVPAPAPKKKEEQYRKRNRQDHLQDLLKLLIIQEKSDSRRYAFLNLLPSKTPEKSQKLCFLAKL